jgi:hypothetical protein
MIEAATIGLILCSIVLVLVFKKCKVDNEE